MERTVENWIHHYLQGFIYELTGHFVLGDALESAYGKRALVTTCTLVMISEDNGSL